MAGIDDALEGPHPAHLAHRVGGPAQVVREHPALGRLGVPGPAEHVPRQRDVDRVPEMRERLGDARGALRDQELVGVDERHPAERAAEVRGGVGVGQHLVVDLAPEPGVGQQLPPGDDGARGLGQGGAQDRHRPVRAAVVVDEEVPHPGAVVEGRPLGDVPGLVPDDQRDRDAGTARVRARRHHADAADLAEDGQLPEHRPLRLEHRRPWRKAHGAVAAGTKAAPCASAATKNWASRAGEHGGSAAGGSGVDKALRRA